MPETSNTTLRGLAPPEDNILREAVNIFTSLERNVGKLEAVHVDALVAKHEWGLLRTMHKRAAAHCGACIVLHSNDHPAAAEALARTVIEATINVRYCISGDSVARITSYFKHYIQEEKQQNKRWASTLSGPPIQGADREAHMAAMRQKERALQIYEETLAEVFGQIGYDYGASATPWPSIFDRFRTLNDELGYRTVYAALCSQAHNDAEDLLNEFTLGVKEADDGMKTSLRRENSDFSLYVVMMGLAALVESARAYLGRCNVDVGKFRPLLARAYAGAKTAAVRPHQRAAQRA